ncbi:MAG: Mov34/MPN/PAD-1 family protein [Candidatus Hermodarchaeota archaeon]|nr:Mov34/MPN/PAD-1 family protein [Candidatus Hermodarchaeota archaeon]
MTYPPEMPPENTADSQGNDILKKTPQVYPVYVYRRTCQAIFDYCLHEAQRPSPREALGVILGFRRLWQGKKYIRVTDWATGRVEASIAYARFTPEGILEYRLALHDRYGTNPHTPRVVGLWHSHPFGGDPHFSSTDLHTFFNTPFCAEGNVFFLIDPLSCIFKVYMLRPRLDEQGLQLEQVDWCTYQPSVTIKTEPSLNEHNAVPEEEDTNV